MFSGTAGYVSVEAVHLNGKRFEELDGWRGVCALLVALYHSHFAGHLYGSQFLRNSHLWVDFFFVLSGFVITHAYADRLATLGDFRAFLTKRFWRLWPLHVFVLALFVGLEIVKLGAVTAGFGADSPPFTGRTSLASFVTNAFLIQSLGIHDDLTWNRPAWSISVEFYTYVLFAIFACLCAALPRKRLGAWWIGAACVTVWASSIVIFFSDRLMDVTYDLGLARCVYGFFVGVVAYRYFAYRQESFSSAGRSATPGDRSRLRFWATLNEATSVAFTLAFVMFLGDTRWSFATPVVFLWPLIVFAGGLGAVSAVLRQRVFQVLGVLSYSVYMVHSFMLEVSLAFAKLAEKRLGVVLLGLADKNGIRSEAFATENQWFGDAITVVYIASVLGLAFVTHRYVELPGNRLGKCLARKSSHSQGAGDGSALP